MNKNNNSHMIDIYNCAYNDYLLKMDPIIIFHTFITETIKLTGAQYGVVMNYDCDTTITEIITHTSKYKDSNMNTTQDISIWLFFSNYVRKQKVLNSTSIIMQCITQNRIKIENNCHITQVLGIDDSVQNNVNASNMTKEMLMFIPCCINGHANGLIIISFEKELTDHEKFNLIDLTKNIGDMVGILMNNIKIRPYHCVNNNEQHPMIKKKNINCKTNIDESCTFQLVHDTLNIVNDTVVITDADMRIIYKNDNFLNMIKSRYQLETIPEYLIDVVPQTITLMGSKDDVNNKYGTGFYRNKKIVVDDKCDQFQNNESCYSMVEIIINSTVSCGSIYHILRFCDKDILNNPTETIGKSKNLIAYLSHELRNPIQAISTGVYLIDRTVKNMIKKMNETPLHTEKNSRLSLLYPQIHVKNNDSSKNSTDSSSDDKDKDNLCFKRNNSEDKETLKTSKLLRRSYIKANDTDDTNTENSVTSETEINDLNSELTLDDIDQNIFVQSQCQYQEKDLISSDIMNDSLTSNDSGEEIDSTLNNNFPNNYHNGKIHDIDSVDSLDTLRSVIKRVNNACKNMNIIIDDILDLSKIENDELIMNFDEHSLREITDMIVEESKLEVNKKGLQFIYDFDINSPEIIYTDGTRLFQILSNLISNAIKYSNTGVIKFEVSYDSENNTIIFQVIDQGRGIRNEEITNLFKQFGRTSNSVTDINSTGLGLCVCNKIAALLGGSINVTSAYKKGSTFTFTHPIKLGYSGNYSKVERHDNKEIKGDILIVDDDPNIISLFKLLLRCMNYDKGYDLNIETAYTGGKAIQLADIKQYDLIFMDIDLDGEDGCTVCNRILNDSTMNRLTPIVAVTANIKSIQHDRDSRFDLFSDVILKPFSDKNITYIVTKYLCK